VDERARIRINLSQRELEIEGPRSFLDGYGGLLERLLAALEAQPAPAAVTAATAGLDPGESFGAFIQHLPIAATDVDRMLAAGYWVQRRSGDDAFATAEASRRLVEHGLKIGNPSQCVKQALLAKRVFVHQRGRYRVSQQGRQHLRQVMGVVIEA
jgi:hypothetical protein